MDPPKTAGGCLQSWEWGGIDPAKTTYEALFPIAWTHFKEPIEGVNVTIRQVSPFLPHSYSEASLPVCLFYVEVENTGVGEIECSVMFTFQNGDGGDADSDGCRVHHSFSTEMKATSFVGEETKHDVGFDGVMGVRPAA
jgi:uncharacterized protein (DUF608 family)